MQNTNGIEKEEINKIRKYIESENFDTDSLFYDVENERQSNVLLQTSSTMFRSTFYDYIQLKKGIYPKNICSLVILHLLPTLYSQRMFI